MTKGRLSSVLCYIHRLVGVPEAENETDRQLLGRFAAQGDKRAFADLVRRHGRLVWGVCWRVLGHEQDAEDAFQATFLVLAQKAGSVRWRESVANWLYGVAYRLARRARADTARGRAHERLAAALARPEALPEAAWRELCAVLDEELHRLPSSYREPLLLCYLQELTQDEAAQRLGWSSRTLRRRLEQARQLLHARLTRRGIGLPAVLLTTGLVQQARNAAVPAALRAATAQAASACAAAKATASSAVSAEAAALAEGALKALAVAKLKTVLGLVLVAGLTAAGAGVLAHQVVGGKQPAEQQQDGQGPAAPNANRAKPEKAGQGRTDRDGDPLPPGALVRLGTVRLRHGNGSGPLVFSSDGKTLISGGQDRLIRFWNADTGKELRRLKGHEGGVQALALSPNDTLLASGGYNGIRLWDMASGQQIRVLRAGAVRSLAFAPDGQTLISGGQGQDHTVRLWDVATGKERRRLLWHRLQVDFVGCTPDGRYLVSASGGESKIVLADMATGAELRTFDSPSFYVEAVALASDGQTVAVAGGEWRGGTHGQQPALRLLDLATGKVLRRLSGHQQRVQVVAFAPDGKTLASAGYDRTLRLWDVATGREVRQINTRNQGIGRLIFTPDGKKLAASGQVIRLWDAATGRELQRRPGHEGPVNSVAFAPDGRTLASTSFSEHSVRLWDAATGEQLRLLPGHDDYVRAVAFLPDGKALVSGGGDSSLRLWDAATGRQIRLFPLHDPKRGEKQQQVLSMGLSADGKRLLASSTGFEGRLERELTLTAWEVATGKRLFRWQEKQPFTVDFPAFAPDGQTLLMSGNRGLSLRDAATNKELLLLKAPAILESPYVFSPDGKLLAVHSSRQRQAGNRFWRDELAVRSYERATGKQRLRIPTSGWSQPLVFSPDNRTLAAAGEQGISLWELATGKERWRFGGDDVLVSSAAFSPDGRHLATGLADSTVLIWDLAPVQDGQDH